MKDKVFKVGDRVRLTGKFCRNTGQYTGSDANGSWTIIALCDPFVQVDQDISDLYPNEPEMKYRRFHPNNLELDKRARR